MIATREPPTRVAAIDKRHVSSIRKKKSIKVVEKGERKDEEDVKKKKTSKKSTEPSAGNKDGAMPEQAPPRPSSHKQRRSQSVLKLAREESATTSRPSLEKSKSSRSSSSKRSKKKTSSKQKRSKSMSKLRSTAPESAEEASFSGTTFNPATTRQALQKARTISSDDEDPTSRTASNDFSSSLASASSWGNSTLSRSSYHSQPGAFHQPGFSSREESSSSEEEEESPPLVRTRSLGRESFDDEDEREALPETPTLVATLVEEEADGKGDKATNQRRTVYVILCLICLFVVVVAVTFGVLLVRLADNNGSSGGATEESAPSAETLQEETAPSPTLAPTAAPTVAPTVAPATNGGGDVPSPTAAPSPFTINNNPITAVLDFAEGFPCNDDAFDTFTFNQVGMNDAGTGYVEKGEGGHCFMRLTQDVAEVRASAFASVELNPSAFQVDIQYRMYSNAAEGADGMVFVMHQDWRGVNALGSGGDDLGYLSSATGEELIQNSVGVFMQQLNSESLGIYLSGATQSEEITPVRTHDQQAGRLQINYCWQSKRLRVFQSNSLQEDLVLRTEAPFKPAELWNLDNPIYIGFTAATGGITDNHEIHSLTLSTTEAC